MSEALAPGAVAKVVADRHGIGTGLLFTWRREMLATAVSGFAPVAVVSEPRGTESEAPAKAGGAPGATLRVNGAVDPAMLRIMLAKLGGLRCKVRGKAQMAAIDLRSGGDLE